MNDLPLKDILKGGSTIFSWRLTCDAKDCDRIPGLQDREESFLICTPSKGFLDQAWTLPKQSQEPNGIKTAFGLKNRSRDPRRRTQLLTPSKTHIARKEL